MVVEVGLLAEAAATIRARHFLPTVSSFHVAGQIPSENLCRYKEDI
jgi:hypothetical protein